MTEMGQRYHDPIETGMRATGEFAKGAYKGVVENGENIFYGTVIGLFIVAGIFFSPVVGLTSLAVGTATGLALLFTNNNDNKRKN